MPNTDRVGALNLAEKLRDAVRESPLDLPAPIRLCIPAKKQGRDCVVWADALAVQIVVPGYFK